MDTFSDWGTFTQEINLYAKHKKLTVLAALLFIFSLIGGIAFLAYKSGSHPPDSLTQQGNPLQFDSMGNTQQGQGSVMGANTEQYGTAEPPASVSAAIIPSQPAAVTSAPSPTPTPAPATASSPTNTPTPTPTSAPAANTPSPTPTPTPGPTATNVPTVTPDATPTLTPTTSTTPTL